MDNSTNEAGHNLIHFFIGSFTVGLWEAFTDALDMRLQVIPRPLERNVRLVCVSDEALVNIMDMDPQITSREEFLEFIVGRKLPYGALPVAHRYGGHQYGLWVGQLGDGRAHILGEYVNRKGERWQIQLKGSGQTPYARIHDGRSVLRSGIREMVACEACHHLGIPTTRAAALVVIRMTQQSKHN